jgi:ubiquinone/menaquinone biosynthesis C-methylase UbiE
MSKHLPKVPKAERLAEQSRAAYERSSAHMDRGLDAYNSMFKINLANRFRGRLLLILGAGAADTAANELRGQDVMAVSLNPMWGSKRFRRQHRPGTTEGMRVAANAQQLPFESGIFSGVIAGYSVPRHLPQEGRHYKALFREVHRVMAEDGVAFMAPIYSGLSVGNIILRNTLEQTVGPNGYKIVNPENNTLCIPKHLEQFTDDPLAMHLAALDDSFVTWHPTENQWYGLNGPWTGPESTGV